MRIAVFLDVDKTLTEGFIQREYAKALKCEPKYSDLEEQYQRKTISSKTFGDKIIELFAGKDFTQVEANGHYDDIKLKPDAKALLEQQMRPGLVKADIYLASSGPSYYIDALAARYKIDEKNCCRSVYKFNHGTGLIESCVAIDDQDKADFVSKKKEEGKYDITIGVGDNAGLDGAFLSQCTVRLMTEETGTYLHIPKLTSLPPLIERLSKISHAEISDERLVALVKEKCEQNPELLQDLQGLCPSGPIDDEDLLALLKERCEQNPKLLQNLQRLYSAESIDDVDLLAMFKERCEENPILTQGLPKTNTVLPAVLLALTLLVVVLSALRLASRLTLAVLPAIVAIILLAAGGVLLIHYWKSSRRGPAFWWVMAAVYVLQIGLVAAIFRDVFYDNPHQWVSPEVRWALIPAILAFLAAPALEDPARKLMGKVAKTGAR